MPPFKVNAGPQPSSPTAAFITDHLALAAYLTSCGHRAALSAARSGRVLFAFDQSEVLSRDLQAFSAGTAQVDLAAYDAARIQLRRQMDALLGGAR